MKHLLNELKIMKRIICILFVLLHCCLNVSAQSADKAQKQYMQKDYVGAIATYEKLLTDTAVMQGNIRAKANVYYNLANCYYRTNNYALAVLNYQRALRIDPSDKDAAFNLQLTQTKLQDQFTPPSEMFFVTWMRMFIECMSATAWGYCALYLLVIATCIWILCKWLKRAMIKKIGMAISCLLLVFSLLSFAFAYAENNYMYAQKQVVVISMCNAYDSPTQGAKVVKELHEGVLLDVEDEQQGGWLYVEMPDGNKVWVKNAATIKV